MGPEMISGVRASSMRMESTSSTMAKLNSRWMTRLASVEFHIVPEVIEPEFVIGAVGDVAVISDLPFLVIQAVLDDAYGRPRNL